MKWIPCSYGGLFISVAHPLTAFNCGTISPWSDTYWSPHASGLRARHACSVLPLPLQSPQWHQSGHSECAGLFVPSRCFLSMACPLHGLTLCHFPHHSKPQCLRPLVIPHPLHSKPAMLFYSLPFHVIPWSFCSVSSYSTWGFISISPFSVKTLWWGCPPIPLRLQHHRYRPSLSTSCKMNSSGALFISITTVCLLTCRLTRSWAFYCSKTAYVPNA